NIVQISPISPESDDDKMFSRKIEVHPICTALDPSFNCGFGKLTLRPQSQIPCSLHAPVEFEQRISNRVKGHGLVTGKRPKHRHLALLSPQLNHWIEIRRHCSVSCSTNQQVTDCRMSSVRLPHELIPRHKPNEHIEVSTRVKMAGQLID